MSRTISAAFLASLCVGTALSTHAQASAPVCPINPSAPIQHVVNIIFDNVHLERDNPNVPSDLEQMPHLLSFLKTNGTLSSNHHPILISHTGNDIIAWLSGNYGDRMGQPVSNSFDYYSSAAGATRFTSSFQYWTDKLPGPNDTTPYMVNEAGKIAPAPWVAFTRAGCDVGMSGVANSELENTSTGATGDITTVFGSGSPTWNDVKANPGAATANYVGVAIHCAQNSTLCTDGSGNAINNAVPDLLTDEPNGYNGFYALFGHKYAIPPINGGSVALTNLFGETIQDSNGNVGFPGFDGQLAKNSLAYAAQFIEHGVPVAYVYVSDAHDNHTTATAFGPGEAGYVQQLQNYDTAFNDFFTRLAGEGITPANTLFIISADENDHFAGSQVQGCDGVTTPCVYNRTAGQTTIGEVTVELSRLLFAQTGETTPFDIHFDSAPNVWIQGNPTSAGPAYPAPAQNDPLMRKMEQEFGSLTYTDPVTGVNGPVAQYIVDYAGQKLLHMVTSDPLRTPNFTIFQNPDYYSQGPGFHLTPTTPCTTAQPCVYQSPAFAWNHGDVQTDITNDWLGIVGPGVANSGQVGTVWSDSTDVRPTVLSLVGLADDYTHDGRPLVEFMNPSVLPANAAKHAGLQKLLVTYKQINSAFGQLGLLTLKADTKAVKSSDPTFTSIENQLTALATSRDTVATQIKSVIDTLFYQGGDVTDAQIATLQTQANAVLVQAASIH